jgi:integrase
MREQEIFSIRKSHVNLERRFLSVTHTKTGRDRTVPINETLKEILDRRMQNDRSEYLFYNSKGQKLTVLTNAFWYAVKMAGLIRTEIDRGESKDIRFRFHDCRQTFGSRLGMAGKDLKTIMDIMGHSTVKVAMRYQHPMPEHKLDAVKILDQVPSVFTTSKEQERKIVNLHR